MTWRIRVRRPGCLDWELVAVVDAEETRPEYVADEFKVYEGYRFPECEFRAEEG